MAPSGGLLAGQVVNRLFFSFVGGKKGGTAACTVAPRVSEI